MARLSLTTDLPAPIGRCFDLSRDIDFHCRTMAHTGERVIAGPGLRSSGLAELGDAITWEARHFGVRQRLSIRITDLQRPHSFIDEMIPRRECGHGAFTRFYHEHRFEAVRSADDPSGPLTRMTDLVTFAAPLGILGLAVESLFLTRYMRRLLARRNELLRAALATPQP
ncbi:MAG: SRPBCC family protein [Phycisphaerales bacterium]|nr:SRPBCC family protein [Phycisphaerales bacterium]